ncbi:hypothetical protein CERZMDRAFT_91765 [Cercospora zeae-maydis SCOH1-5]|uniref:Uncharacterized protein n=1 Tax=Cercospora zeae-maydis SCOH1-5 TaxID=717836 RepID=A0A6A6F119_9PEZI|nr:hypothetical protein CERZMDRAFT_91765 [Cercospora zeae-maydis SCOH1-5]
MPIERTISPFAPWPRAGYATASGNAHPTPPPPPQPYKPIPAKELVPNNPDASAQPLPKKKSLLSRLWPFRRSPAAIYSRSQDPTRGLEAARRVVKEGFLDPRYRHMARRVTAVICAMPILLYTSYELFQRRFMGKEQKTRPVIAPAEDGRGET